MKGESTLKNRTYIAIDLKSFYASVECRERGLDPLDTNLVVADESRTDNRTAEGSLSGYRLHHCAAQDGLLYGV